MKRLVSIAIVLVMALTFCTTAFADVSTYATGTEGFLERVRSLTQYQQ